MVWLRKNWSGLTLALLVALAAFGLGRLFPVVGGAVFGILLGIVVSSAGGRGKSTEPGLAFTSKKVLQWSIILLGSGLNLARIYETGQSSLIIILTTITAALIAAWTAGRFLRVDFHLKSLIGVGTAICGGSAIAAVAPIIEARDEDVAYAISTVFLFNVAAVFLFPFLGHLIGMSQQGFGLFAGTAINDTSSVVAAGYAYGNLAGDSATIVKLTRTLMIIPVALIFALAGGMRRRGEAAGGARFSLGRIFPWFILGFVLMAALNTSGLAGEAVMGFLKEAGKFMIIMALSAIGLKTDLKKLLATGPRPAFLGLAVWAAVACTSLLLQRLGGQW